MAWDALQGRFQQKQRTAEDNNMGAEARNVGVSSGAGASGGYSPQTLPNAGYGGSSGDSAGPVSARFVNYGNLYSLNESKAKEMAAGVGKKAEGKAEGAKNSLDAARNQFGNAYNAGLGKGPVGGPHGTRIDNYNPTTPTTKPAFTQAYKSSGGTTRGAGPGSVMGSNVFTSNTTTRFDANGNVIIDDNEAPAGQLSQTLEGEGTRGLPDPGNYSGAGGTMTGGASRYSQLYGPVSTMGSVAGKPSEVPDKDALKDYHASVDLLGAKSGAGQQYTGPGSLKESMGDAAYGTLGEDLRKAQEGVDALGDAGGIADALGYGDSLATGNSALDTGLTQTAGQAQFKRLKDRYAGLGNLLPAAQADSMKTAEAGGIISAQAAKDWQQMVDDYEAQQNQPETGPDGQPKPKRAGRYAHAYAEGTNGSALLSESGFTAAELEDTWGDLTQEERQYLIRGNNVFENLTGYGFSGDEATLKQNILMKLAKRRTGTK